MLGPLSATVKEERCFEEFRCALRVHISVQGRYSSGQQPFITNEPLAHHLLAVPLYICQHNVLILQIFLEFFLDLLGCLQRQNYRIA